MTNAQKKIIKNYKRELRHLFPVFTKNEKRFFCDICNSITDYTNDDDGFTLESLIQNIGEPKDIVSRYLLDMDGETLRKSLFRTKYIRFTLGIIILIAIVTGTFKMRTDYLSFLEGREAYIHRETIEIIEHSETESTSEDTIK